MNLGLSGISSISNGQSALSAAKISGEKGKFDALVRSVASHNADISSSQISAEGRLNGDFKSGFEGTFKSASAKNASPLGAAANQSHPNAKPRTIDKTSKLYEKCMEMESYFVKMMVSQMRKTVVKADGGGDFASKMYEDMLYEEYSVAMTKSAGFGIADQMYLQLSADSVNVEA